MKTINLLAPLFCSVALAQDAQIPLKEKAQQWFDVAKSYIPSGVPSIPNPVDAGAAAVAGNKVQKISIANFERVLAPKPEGEEEWLIYTTGGNKTCFGRCGKVDLAWNESVPLLTALPQTAGSPALHLGQIDCEKENVLCAGWALACPGILHFFIPQQTSKQQPRPERFVDLNTTTTTPQDIVRLASSAPNSRIMSVPEYDGMLHPFDSVLAKAGVQSYLGYAIHFLGSTPSWLIMITISFLSRQFMGSRTRRNAPDAYNPQPGAVQPAPPPAVAPKAATPGSAGKGGKKRR